MENKQGQTAAEPGAQEGRLADKPVAQLVIELLRQRASGAITLVNGPAVRLVHLQAGWVRFAESNIKTESAGQSQVAAGLIKQASFDRAVALARQQGVALHEALAAARVLSPEQLKAALKQQTIDVVLGALSLTEGTYSFAPKPIEAQNNLPDARVSPVSLVVDWARRQGDAAAMRGWLSARAACKVSRSAELERELFALKASWPGESVTPAASGRLLGELLARVKEPELPLLYALALSGLIALVAPGGAALRTPGAGAPPDEPGKIFTPKEQEARRMILSEAQRLKEATHYEVLGVLPNATNEQIRAAYFAAARRFHSDAFSALELGSARRAAEEIFQKINEANQVLTTPKARAEYDVYVDRKAKGLPTDVGQILKAESIFQKGELLFNAGKYEDAELCFREAISLNHAEAEFHAYLGMTLFRRRGKVTEARPHIDKALALDPRLPSAQVFLCALLTASGDEDGARRIIRKVLEQEPDNPLAKAELARQQRDKDVAGEKKRGFFGGFFKK